MTKRKKERKKGRTEEGSKQLEETCFTFDSDLAVGLLLTGLEIGWWLQVVDADDGRRWLIVYHPRPVLLGANLGALPVNVVYRGAAPYFQLALGEMLVRNEKLKADLGNLPLGLVGVQGTVRADVRLQRLRVTIGVNRLNRWPVDVRENSLAPVGAFCSPIINPYVAECISI